MVNPTKYEEADPATRQNMLNEVTPTSKRNIILIRHGQYFMDQNNKNYLSLTPLGDIPYCLLCLRTDPLDFISGEMETLFYFQMFVCFRILHLFSSPNYRPMFVGQEQAKYVGQRLANSGLKFSSVVMSTMARAEETAKLILGELPPTSVKSDPLLEEGAPFPPEPPSKHWRPKHKVMTCIALKKIEVKMYCWNIQKAVDNQLWS